MLRNISIAEDDTDGRRIHGRAGVSYPATWSVKDAGELRPHLSSLDAVVLAVGLGECHLAHAHRLNPEQRRRAWVRSLEIRATGQPVTELSDFEVWARVAESRRSPVTLCGHVSTLDCRIGGIKVRCALEHEPGDVHDAAASFLHSEELLGRGQTRYYAEGYKRVRRHLEDLHVDPSAGAARALVTVEESADDHGQDGVGAAYRPALSPIDAIIVVAQMAQAVLYSLDDVDRGSSNTLWMRRISMAFPSPFQPIVNPFVTTLSTVGCRITEMRGDRWRTADMAAQLLGGSGSFSVTHALPAN